MARALAVPLVLLAAGFGAFLGIGAWLDRWARAPLAFAEPSEFVVRRGAAFAEVAGTIHRAGVIDDTFRLALRARQRGLTESLRSGEYRVEPGITADMLLDLMNRGEVVSHFVRIEEGSTVAGVLERLAADPRLRFDLPRDDGRGLAEDLAVPLPANGSLEGRFFPDTYQFERGYPASALLRRAHETMARELAAAWEARAAGLPYATPDEALVLASMVEKETGRADERARVAGVFVRRLGAGMRLQSDPTVIYGLSDYDGNLTRAHLAADTPWNTYRRHGLPPTPIALPGREAIVAALHPEAGRALYFVARGDGTSQFSETLEQHNRAVRRYQLGGT